MEDENTEQLVPVQKSCCYCIPRRLGMIVLALIKLVLNLGLIVLLTYALFMSYIYHGKILLYRFLIWIAIVLDVIDIVIALIVSTSVCMNKRKTMKTYYIYSICIFGLLTFMCCVVVYISTENFVFLLIFLFIFVLIFTMQEYLNFLLKSEVEKQESGEQSQL